VPGGNRTASAVVWLVVVLVSTSCSPDRASAEPSGPLTELVDAAARRLQVAEPVAAAKWHSAAASDTIHDPDRVRQELDALAVEATSAQIDSEYVRQVFGDQIDATEAIEYSRFAQWKLDPTAVPAVAPALSDSRSAIDELNHVMLTHIALPRLCRPARQRQDRRRAEPAPRHPLPAGACRCVTFLLRAPSVAITVFWPST
jgi:chorismate mutase-like protein